MALSEIIKVALDHIQYVAKTETVIGEPIVAGGTTLIPVSKVSVGFAAGGGGKDDVSGSGAGTGGGVNVTPIAFISISGDKVDVHSLTGSDQSLSKIMSAAPDVFKKISKYMKKKDDTEKEESSC
ncbi:sporulation protein YtfJ [Chitinispirillum alkaliphilum]|nr:sporulation protein YtfJ [Chitinispirillum alkaliphilum]